MNINTVEEILNVVDDSNDIEVHTPDGWTRVRYFDAWDDGKDTVSVLANNGHWWLNKDEVVWRWLHESTGG